MTNSGDSEELGLFRDMIIRFLDQEIVPHYEQWEADHLMPREAWRTLGEAGMLLVDMPEEYGGAGASFEVCQMVQEEMCARGLLGLATGYNIHANVVPPYILNIGTRSQREQWLPRLVTGDAVAALGMTEPGAGSDLAALRSTALRDGDSYVINGSKTFISNGIHADLALIAAKTDPAAGAKGISLFLVDTSLEGFERGSKIEKIGQHSSDTAELFFNDLRVPADALLGEEGQGFIYMMQELPRERLGCAAQAVAHAEGALNITVDYVQERQAFGQAVGKFQNTRFKLAEIKAELELCRALLEKNMAKYAEGAMTAEDGAILKFTATEMQVRAVNECLQLFGGYGYTDEYPISRFYRDARVQTIYAGSSEIMKELIARGILGR